MMQDQRPQQGIKGKVCEHEGWRGGRVEGMCGEGGLHSEGEGRRRKLGITENIANMAGI